MCVSQDVLRFNTTVEPTAVRNWVLNYQSPPPPHCCPSSQCFWGISWFGNFDLLLLLAAAARIPDAASVRIPIFLRNFLTMLLRGFQYSWGISWFGNFDLLLLLLAVAARIPIFLRNFLIWEFRSPPPPRCYCADSNILDEFLNLGISISSSSSLLLLHGFLTLLLHGFHCSWGISWFGNFDLLLLLLATIARILDIVAARIPLLLRNFLIWEFRSPPPPPHCCCADS